nr:MAG TPA: hypothetical protein [Caudoviricetes sp.]
MSPGIFSCGYMLKYSPPASATNNDIASCKATSYVVFSF